MFELFLPVGNAEVWWPGLVLLGFLIGMITGFFGIGGGFLLTPALKICFNVSYPVAIGSSLLQISLTSLLSAYKYWRQKSLDTKMGVVTAIAALIGTECGVRILKRISMTSTVKVAGYDLPFTDLVINSCFFVLMVLTAAFMYREASQGDRGESEEPRTKIGEIIRSCPLPPFLSFHQSKISQLSLWVPTTLSFFVGCLTGLLGIGGGFIGLPIMIYLLGMPTRIAVGTSTIQVLLASCYGMFRHMQQGHVDILLVAFMLAGSIAGVNIGVKIAQKADARDTRKYFAALLLLGILLIIYDMLHRFV